MIAALLSYLPALLLTLLLESLVVLALAPRTLRGQALQVCVALNLLTHPAATLLAARAGFLVLELEALVFCCEWLGYLRLLPVGVLRALVLALTANLVSAVAGFVLWAYISGP